MRPSVPVLVLACLLGPIGMRSALAQGLPDDAERHRLIERGIAASDAADHARALEFFEQAGRIQMRPGLRMAMAEEMRSLRMTREACEMASLCVEEVQSDLTRPESTRVFQGCAQLVSSSCANLGRLRIHLPTPLPPELRVSIQGRTFTGSDLETIVAITPGAVIVRAITLRGDAFEEQVSVLGGETRDVTVALRAPIATPVTPSIPAPAERARRAPVRPDPAPAVTTLPDDVPYVPVTRGGAGAGPWVVGSLGLAGFATAAAFWWGVRPGAEADRNAACHAATMSCDPAAQDAQNRGQTATLVTNISIGIGVAGLAIGAIWLIAAPSETTTMVRSAWSVDVTPAASGGFARLTTVF